MLPLGDTNVPQTRSFPVVNIAIIVVNILVFVYELSLGTGLDNFITGYGSVPYEIVHNTDLVGPFAGLPFLETAGPSPIYLTLLTSMFMHGGWAHIGGNMLYLFIFGDNVEDRMGSLVYTGFYFAGGLVASFTQIFVTFNFGSPADVGVPSIGASGAIAAVLGAYLVMFPQAQIRTLLTLGYFGYITRVAAIFVLGIWFVLQFFDGIGSITGNTAQTGGVAVWAHVGGFVFGALIAFFFYRGSGQTAYGKQTA
jgi:membrane associated rhomboid family serine protease